MIYVCERRLQIEAPAEAVWDWMSDLRRLLSLNPFHVQVDSAQPVNKAGQRVPVRHNVFGLYRRVRIARIRVYRPFHVAWGELQEHGRDWFPHSQSFTVLPVGAHRCTIVNRLRGKFPLPGARYWLLPFYHRLACRILDQENMKLAAHVSTTPLVRKWS